MNESLVAFLGSVATAIAAVVGSWFVFRNKNEETLHNAFNGHFARLEKRLSEYDGELEKVNARLRIARDEIEALEVKLSASQANQRQLDAAMRVVLASVVRVKMHLKDTNPQIQEAIEAAQAAEAAILAVKRIGEDAT